MPNNNNNTKEETAEEGRADENIGVARRQSACLVRTRPWVHPQYQKQRAWASEASGVMEVQSKVTQPKRLQEPIQKKQALSGLKRE